MEKNFINGDKIKYYSKIEDKWIDGIFDYYASDELVGVWVDDDKEHMGKYTGDMSFIVFPPSRESGSHPSDYLSDREKRIVLSTIQWLGSPVGQGFLDRNNFKLKENV